MIFALILLLIQDSPYHDQLNNVHSSNYICRKRITHFFAFIHDNDAFLISANHPALML